MRCYALALLLLAACGGDDQGGTDAGPDGPSAACLEANDHSDLTWLQDKVFQPSCANFTACHKGAAPDAASLSLERGSSYPGLVDADSTLFPQFKLVAPNDPAQSYLMIIMGQYPGPLTDKGTMPLNNPLMCKEKRDAIERWIMAGAPDET